MFRKEEFRKRNAPLKLRARHFENGAGRRLKSVRACLNAPRRLWNAGATNSPQSRFLKSANRGLKLTATFAKRWIFVAFTRRKCGASGVRGSRSTFPRSEERRVGKGSRYRWSRGVSSRRRHTRLVSDWSSDVCSSDLLNAPRRLWNAGATNSPQSRFLKSANRGLKLTATFAKRWIFVAFTRRKCGASGVRGSRSTFPVRTAIDTIGHAVSPSSSRRGIFRPRFYAEWLPPRWSRATP